jgi:hypothetical protein
MLGFDVYGAYLAAVLARMEIGTGTIMRVIETEARWSRRESYAAHPVRRDEGRPFFGGAIHVSRDYLTVPMQLLRSVCVVVDFDRRCLTFLES